LPRLSPTNTNGALLLRSPTYCTSCEHENEAQRGLTVVHVTGPVGIHEAFQDNPVRDASLENEFPVTCGSKVVECVIKCVLVVDSGASGVLPKCGNGVGQVWVSTKHEVHECAYGALVWLDFDLG
jgi:hypothetical protein